KGDTQSLHKMESRAGARTKKARRRTANTLFEIFEKLSILNRSKSLLFLSISRNTKGVDHPAT
ncbi:MAG: hypothetical protein U0411_08820, partial [Thermodesulfovibrionales bacterium]